LCIKSVESVRMPVNFQIAFNKFFAKKQKMQNENENGDDDDDDDDEASRNSFEVKAVTIVPDDHTNGSSITKEGGRAATWFIDRYGRTFESPYEKGYSAETYEELFHEVSDFFDSFKASDFFEDQDNLNLAKDRLRDFKPYSNTVENSFITAVCFARGKLNAKEVLVLPRDQWPNE
jgi:hypothetical protein